MKNGHVVISKKSKKIRIQHDNAPVHFGRNDIEWVEATQQYADRFSISIKDQPANSPDTNILDLGFFAALQSIQHKQTPAGNIDELVLNVLNAWEVYDPKLINRTFITHQSVCDEILQCHGGNDYTIPHLAKGALERQGRLPSVLRISQQANDAIAHFAIPP